MLKAWIVLGGLLALLVGGGVLRELLDIQWSADSIRTAVAAFGLWAPVIFVAMVTFRVAILVPSQLLLAAGGFLFGALPATLYGAIGITLSALIKFSLVRWAGAERLGERVPPRFRGALALARSRAGAGAVAVITGYPVGPITLVHAASAATGMAIASFAVAVAAGSLVRSATYAYFGSALAEGEGLLWSLVVIAAAAGLPLLHPRPRAWVRRSLRAADQEPSRP